MPRYTVLAHVRTAWRALGGQKTPGRKGMSKLALILATTALFGLADPAFADKAGAAAQTRGGPLAQARRL